MTTIDKKMLLYLTDLSRIHCTEEEQSSLMEDLSKIVRYVDQLSEIDTENVKPCDHVLEEMINVMRPDEVGNTLSRDEFLGNSPEHIAGLIRVPPVIQQK